MAGYGALVSVPVRAGADGMAWYFTDVTKSYQRRAEREAAERAAASGLPGSRS